MVNSHSGLLVVALMQCSTPPESWCMPSPNTSRSPTTAGELTEASLRYGDDLLHTGSGADFAAIGNRLIVGRLKPPSPDM